MEYNTSQPHMVISEYGRNVQKMVDYLGTIEDREERNRQARNLVAIIGNLNPQVGDVADAEHKLWDHLHIMSNFSLDVDSPYPAPEQEKFNEKPEKVEYPANNHRYRYYGSVIKKMISYLAEMEAGEEKEALKTIVANQMKKSYLTWNKDTVADQVILQEMNDIANGKLNLEELSLSDKSELVQNNKKKFKKRPRKRFKHKK